MSDLITPDPLPIVRSVPALRKQIAHWRSTGARIALVPTMGALHAGHLSLIAAARGHADRVVASLFVNPAQFGPHEDLDRYPRTEAADAEALADAGCDLLFAPAVAEMYPAGFATSIRVGGLAVRLCGAARPGHFDGVATVVTKLLLQATPDVALFGEKDWQQLTIIRRLVRDLDLPVEIVGGAIVRDADGLALSSRNIYLSTDERHLALVLPQALNAARKDILGGMPVAVALEAAHVALNSAGFAKIDYVELTGAEDLAPIAVLDRPARLLAAAWMGTTRLIDNLAVEP